MEDLDCLGTVLLVEVGRLRELRIVDGLVEAENQKGSGMTQAGYDNSDFGGREHWGANTTNGVKQGTSRDTNS